MLLHVLLTALAPLAASTYASPLYMVPPEDPLLRCCDAEPIVPAALRNATPFHAVELPGVLSDCAFCGATCFGTQPVVLGPALGASDCVRPPEMWDSVTFNVSASNGAIGASDDACGCSEAADSESWAPGNGSSRVCA